MAETSHLVTDLALILISAGVITLIFKMLKQPLVLGYIIAGFLVGPHFGLFPTVIEIQSVEQWSEIGIIFLLFALGLEFSFKKLFKVGSTGLIVAGTEVITVGLLGVIVGYLMGWTTMECIFLGGMLVMSSTVIIIKAFDDLGVKKQQFANLTLVVLILQDLVAVVLMVLLSTAAVSQQFAGKDMIYSVSKLIFFLVLWFLIGIYILPSFFKYFRSIMNDETLLIISIGLCLGMVVIAENTGFSSALGAFVMGSILAETIEAERIEKLTKGIKDLFGAVFFISVGMMVNTTILQEYWLPILVLTFVTIFGKTFFSALGVLIAGQNLRTSLQVGFSLSQIGEFAFIIATLGMSLNVLSSYIYPVIVAVSVITTFTTPYCIKVAEPIASWLEKHLPEKTMKFLSRYSSGSINTTKKSNWNKLIKSYIIRVVTFSVILIAIIIISFTWLFPYVQDKISGIWGGMICAVITIVAMTPFLRGLTIQKREDATLFSYLWGNSIYNRGILVALILLRIFLVTAFVSIVLSKAFSTMSWNIFVIAFAIVIFILFSRKSFRRFANIEKHFIENLNQRENERKRVAPIQTSIDTHFSGKDIHLSHMIVPADFEMVGKTLAQAQIYTKYGISIVKIERGSKDIYLPEGREFIYPSDCLVVLGSDQKISEFHNLLQSQMHTNQQDRKNMILTSFVIDKKSPYINKTIEKSDIKRTGKCMVIAIERNGIETFNPPLNTMFEIDDIVWIVGEKSNVKDLL